MNRLNDEQIAKILVDNSYLEPELVTVMISRARTRSIPFINVLLSEQFLTKDLLGQALAEYYKVPYADLNSVIPSKEQVLLIPEVLAREYNLVVFKFDKKSLIFTTDDPKNPRLIQAIEQLATSVKDFAEVQNIEVSYSLTDDIENLFAVYEKPLPEKLTKLLESHDVPVKELVEAILENAFETKATDIHFEPNNLTVQVRFRIDGMLHEVADLTKEVYEKVINRIKVLARLRIDEHFSIQDGAFAFESGKKKFDLRVSFVPTLYGEKMALRALSQYVGGLGLEQVGLSPEHQELLMAAAKKPFGMIIVSGPTGSGKTTTLYSVLSKVISPGVNIMTIEDPVEYRVKGITQVQVNKETGITFTAGLRSLVRQDPDVILVGEIRDKDSAEIAVNAALTGHLLLSTFHANDSATVIPRMADMGVEPFLLSSTLELIIAQRLVRKLCENCRVSVTKSAKSIQKEYGDVSKYFGSGSTTMYEAKGCEQCGFRGFKGRTAIFELLPMTKELKEKMLTLPSADEIRKMSKKMGMKSMFEDGVDKVRKGITTIGEVLRVAQMTD